MTYVFACPKCKETKELDMKIVEYEKMKEALDFPLCKCGIRMDRVYTPPSFLGSTGGYDAVAGKASWQNR
jgi:hypothetical protein